MHLYCHVTSINICDFACINTEFHLPVYYKYQKRYYNFFLGSACILNICLYISPSKALPYAVCKTKHKHEISCNFCIHFSLLFTSRAVLSILICISHKICITDYKMITSFLIAFKFLTLLQSESYKGRIGNSCFKS